MTLPQALRRPRMVIGVGVVLAAVVLVLAGRLSSDEIDPNHVSRSAAPDGLRAFTDLVSSYGARAAVTSAGGTLPVARTAVVLEPAALTAAEVANLQRFADSGGRLLTIGATGALGAVFMADPPGQAIAGDGAARVVAPVPETAGVTTVEGTDARFTSAGAALPAIADETGAWLVVAGAGRGRVLMMASVTPLTNRLLAQADNAAFALGAVGGPGRDITFVDHRVAATGLAAIPTRWRWALGLLTVAALTLVVAFGRRLGPPDRPARPLPPPRGLYVDAMARLVGRSRRPDEALAPLRANLDWRLTGMGLVGHDRSEVAATLGLSDAEATALFVRVDDEDGLLVAGRAFARIVQRGKARM